MPKRTVQDQDKRLRETTSWSFGRGEVVCTVTRPVEDDGAVNEGTSAAQAPAASLRERERLDLIARELQEGSRPRRRVPIDADGLRK